MTPARSVRGRLLRRRRDSNLYLRRQGDQLTLSVEHRTAASITAVSLQLAVDGDGVALATSDREPAPPASASPTIVPPSSLTETIEAQLVAAAMPLTAAALRKRCRVRNAAVTTALADLVAAGRIRKDPTGYAISR